MKKIPAIETFGNTCSSPLFWLALSQKRREVKKGLIARLWAKVKG